MALWPARGPRSETGHHATSNTLYFGTCLFFFFFVVVVSSQFSPTLLHHRAAPALCHQMPAAWLCSLTRLQSECTLLLNISLHHHHHAAPLQHIISYHKNKRKKKNKKSATTSAHNIIVTDSALSVHRILYCTVSNPKTRVSSTYLSAPFSSIMFAAMTSKR